MKGTNTPNTPQQLKEKLSLVRDEVLLRIAEGTQSEYTPEARTIIEAEVSKRGGVEALKERVDQSEKPEQSNEDLVRRRKFFIVAMIAACGLFIFVLNGSSWFYWVCLFALVAALFAVLFNPPVNPEEEIKEMLQKGGSSTSTTKSAENPLT